MNDTVNIQMALGRKKVSQPWNPYHPGHPFHKGERRALIRRNPWCICSLLIFQTLPGGAGMLNTWPATFEPVPLSIFLLLCEAGGFHVCRSLQFYLGCAFRGPAPIVLKARQGPCTGWAILRQYYAHHTHPLHWKWYVHFWGKLVATSGLCSTILLSKEEEAHRSITGQDGLQGPLTCILK